MSTTATLNDRPTLRDALLLFVLVPFMLVMGLGGWYSLHALSFEVESRMQEDIELIARSIRLPLSNALDRGNIHEIEQALDSAFSIDRVYGVYVYDETGQRIAGSGTQRAQVSSDRAAELALERNRQSEFEETGREDIFSFFLPLTDIGGRIIGLLQVTRRGSDFHQNIGQVRQHALVALLITGILLTLIIFIGHYRAIGRHLSAVENGLRRIGTDQPDARVPEHGPSEIHALSQNINSMLDRLAHSQDEIEQRQQRELSLQLRLQESEKLAVIGQLAAGVAHELGTPLSTIDGKAQRALRKDDLATSLRSDLEQMRAEVRRMEYIIHQLLDFGRHNPLQCRPVKCVDLVHTVIDQCTSEAKQRKIAINITNSNNDLEVEVDSVRIEQALTNLLRNAIQAARKQVSINWHAADSGIVFSIEDDGAGITTESCSRLFDPFFTTKPVGSGTGMGLAVAKAAISDHHGEIDVDTSPHLSGARFLVHLPTQQQADAHE
ncbi:MAG: ATP-binding protein [Gammaproteobacteria bacterium]